MKSFLRTRFLLLILIIAGMPSQKLLAQGSSVTCQSNSVYSSGMDSSDIGRFVIGTDTFGTIGSSHLYNPAAVDSYMFYSTDTIRLYLDSTYNVEEAGIMNTIHDAAAKVTLFIDFDNSATYDLPQELVWTAISTPYLNYILDGSFTVPSTATTGMPVMMRLILNNDTSANSASDAGCGTYTSGETEDFVVMFIDASTESVKNIQGLSRIKLWPNPSTGKITLNLNNTKQISQLQVNAVSVTGQQVYTQTYRDVNKQYATTIDLSAMPRGLYFIETVSDGVKNVSKVTLQ